MQIITISSALIILASVNSFAQLTLNGTVIDVQTGEVIHKARIEITGTSDIVFTTADGSFKTQVDYPGNAKLRVSRVGYSGKTVDISKLPGSDSAVRNITIELEPALITPGTIEVHEGRIETQLKYATIPVALVTEDDIAGLPYIAIPNVIEMKTGLNLLRDGIWANEISIRGLSRDNVITLINGNRIETSNNHAGRLALVDINSIERIEFVKGGTSSVYGSGAMGGIVNIITSSGYFSEDPQFSGSITGSFSEVNKLAESSLSLRYNNASFFANSYFTSRNATDIMTPAGVIPNSSFRDKGVHVDAGLKITNKSSIKSTLEYFDSPYAGIPGGKTVFPDGSKTSYLNASRFMADLTYEMKDISNSLSNLSGRIFYQKIEREVEVLPNSSVFVAATSTSPARRIDNISIYPAGYHEVTGLQLRNDFLLSPTNRMVAGIDIWRRGLRTERERTQINNILDSSGSVVSSTEIITGDVPIPESDFLSAGVYVQDQLSFMNENLFLDMSARLDGIFISNEETYSPLYQITNGVRNDNPPSKKLIWPATEVSDVSWSAGAGFNYRLDNRWNLNANFSASYRSPGLEERYQYIDLGTVVRLGNPELQPERGYFTSAGIKYWGEALNLKAEFFLNYLNDLVVEVPADFEGRPALKKENIGSSHIKGFEGEIEYNIAAGFAIDAGVSYTVGIDDETDSPLPQIAPLNFRAGLEYLSPFGLKAVLNSIIYTEQDKVAAGESTTPGYGVFNLYAGAPIYIAEGYSLNLTAGVENIFDKEYRIHLSTSRGPVTSEPGRNFFMNISLNFR